MSYYFKINFEPFNGKTALDYRREIDEEFYSLLSEANRLIGKLDGICRFVSHVEFYEKILLIQEACASCGLENKTVHFYDFFDKTTNTKELQLPANLLNAMSYARNSTFSDSMIKTIYGILMNNEKTEIKYRNSEIAFVNDMFFTNMSQPIPSNWIPTAISDMKKYITADTSDDILIKAAKVLYQFEVLKPFDTYSRMISRMMPALILKWSGFLSHQALGLSVYLLNAKVEYTDRIVATYNRSEDMMSVLWTKFFLRGIIDSASKSIQLIETLEDAREAHMEILPEISNGSKSIQRIYDYVAETVIVSVRQVADDLGLSFSGVLKVVKSFEDAQIVRSLTPKERYRKYGYVPMLEVVDIQ